MCRVYRADRHASHHIVVAVIIRQQLGQPGDGADLVSALGASARERQQSADFFIICLIRLQLGLRLYQTQQQSTEELHLIL